MSRFARQATTEIGTFGDGGGGKEQEDVYKKIRHEVVNKDTQDAENSNSDDEGAAHPLFGVGDRVKDVFSHEWEVQTPKGGVGAASAKSRSGRRGAGDGGRYEQPKSRSIRRGQGRKSDQYGDVLGGEDSDEDNVGRNRDDTRKTSSRIVRAGPTTTKIGGA